MADPRVQSRMMDYQIQCPEIDLSQPQRSSHALYWYNLHIVFENDGFYNEIRDEKLSGMCDLIVKVARKKSHGLSRGGIVANHIHLALSCNLNESPAEVAMAYMNNLSYFWDMRPILKYSCYIGTFGEYDIGVIDSE